MDVGDNLPLSAVVQVIFDDRGVARLRSGAANAIGRLGTVSRPTPRIETEAAEDSRILLVQYLVDGARGRIFGDTIKLLTEASAACSSAAYWRILGPCTERWLTQATAA